VEAADRAGLVAPANDATQVFTWLADADGAVLPALREVFPSGPWEGAGAPAAPAVPVAIQLLREVLGLDDISHVVLGLVREPLQVLHEVLGADARALFVTDRVVRTRPDLNVVMVYIGGFDLVCHSFWQYRFPDEFKDDGPTRADADRLGPVIDRYLVLLDEHLGRLMAAFPTPPDVLVLSDHGEQADHANPLWKGTHSPRGIFIASGPDIPGFAGHLSVSYSDVVPTVLRLEGLQPRATMAGASVLGRRPSVSSGAAPSATAALR
jgi:hypothetical protein